MLIESPTFYGTADAHTRRVTLNLIRASTVCPDDIVAIVDALAADGWDWTKLARGDAEAIYGLVDDALVEKAKAEFAADTTTVVDLDRHWSDAPQFVDEDGDTFCPLCGHKHLRWGFTLKNTVKAETEHELGRDLLTGSTCVVEYGLRVDGTTTAEAALAALNKAIAGLTRKAEREDWRRDHPEHAAELAIVALAESYVGKRWYYVVPNAARPYLPSGWGNYRNYQHADYAKWARATTKYYKANGFLTADRTAQLYGSGALETARQIVAVVESALETSPVWVYWQNWIKRHPGITVEERGIVERVRDANYARDRLYQNNLSVVERVEARHRNLPTPPPPFGAQPAPPVIVAPPAAPKRLVDDVSDLPGMV